MEHHQAHEGRPETAEQLKEAFIALFSDDLLTPLTAIKSAAELIQILGDLGPETRLAQRCASSILESSSRLTAMVGDLLDISRIEDRCYPIAARPISLADFLPDLLARFALPLHGRPLELALDKGVPLVWADPDLLQRVVRNLLIAAIKHSPEGSPILMRASAAGAQIRLSVTDRGAGMTAERLPSALDKIRRPPAGGLGLFLYITRRAVEALGSELHILSEPGAGSTFSFTMPAAGPPGRGPREEPSQG